MMPKDRGKKQWGFICGQSEFSFGSRCKAGESFEDARPAERKIRPEKRFNSGSLPFIHNHSGRMEGIE